MKTGVLFAMMVVSYYVVARALECTILNAMFLSYLFLLRKCSDLKYSVPNWIRHQIVISKNYASRDEDNWKCLICESILPLLDETSEGEKQKSDSCMSSQELKVL